MSDCLRLVKLHEFPQLFNDCALLLNDEWPRSLTARLHSLQKSCDSLPISLVLINNENKVLGHLRLKTEFTDNSSAFIESLIVEKSQRGKGFGKYIINETEILVKQMGFKRMTLTTTDQIRFYKSLGFVSNESFDKNKTNTNQTINLLNTKNNCNHFDSSDHKSDSKLQSKANASPPPPPPPPPPLPIMPVPTNKNQELKVFMFKNI